MESPPTQYLMRAILSILNTEEPLIVCPTEEYEDIYWCDVPEDIRPSKDQVIDEIEKIKKQDDKSQYYLKRAQSYPSIGDQLDALFHAGIFPEEMAAQIQAVKDEYPKPDKMPWVRPAQNLLDIIGDIINAASSLL
jgi:hypothetical protein